MHRDSLPPPHARRRYTQLAGSADALALARLAGEARPLVVVSASALDAQRLKVDEQLRQQRAADAAGADLWDHGAFEHRALLEQSKDLGQLVKAAARIDDGAGADFPRAQNLVRALHVSRTKMEW